MRYILILICVGGFWSSSVGQTGLKLGAYVTPAVGLSFNHQDAEHGPTLSPVPSFSYNMGFFVGYGLAELFSFSTGLGFHELTTAFEHRRRTLSDGRPDPNFGFVALRRAQYVRVPLLLTFTTDPNRPWGLMVRVGPQFDFLTHAVYYDKRLMSYSQYLAHEGIDLRQPVTLYEPNDAGTGLICRGARAPVYRNFVPGGLLEIGFQFRLSDQVQATVLVHGAIAPSAEDEGAASLAHNLTRGDYLVTANPIVDPEAAARDRQLAELEETPFESIFPNYTDPDQPFATTRDLTWSAVLGLQLGVVYTLRDSRSSF